MEVSRDRSPARRDDVSSSSAGHHDASSRSTPLSLSSDGGSLRPLSQSATKLSGSPRKARIVPLNRLEDGSVFDDGQDESCTAWTRFLMALRRRVFPPTKDDYDDSNKRFQREKRKRTRSKRFWASAFCMGIPISILAFL